ncbi:hypothetical protein [Vibrio profundi]|uniref:hypothetical protein n=1 Tax=Vibrio profundi TaxID=1774960 RepID=UPI0037362590
MYFWKIEKLKQDLRNDVVSEQSLLQYLIAHTIIIGLAMLPYYDVYELDMLSAGISIPISVFGILAAYHMSDKHNFLAKFISISWVVGIRLLPLTFLLIFLSINPDSLETTELEVAVMAIVEMIIYWRIAHHIKDTASANLSA